MTHILRRWFVGTTALATLAAAWCFLTGGDTGPAVEGLPALAERIASARRQDRELTAWGNAIFVRAEQRRRTAAGVAAGRLTLPEAAARFRVMNETTLLEGERRQRFRQYPAASEEERDCREVIATVRRWLEERPDGDQDLPRRLEAELNERIRAGTLRPVARLTPAAAAE